MTLKAAATTNLKNNLFQQPVFMDFQLSGARYPKTEKGANKFLQMMNYDPHEIGLIEFTDSSLVLKDDAGEVMQEFAGNQIKGATLALTHSMVRSAPLKVLTNRYMFLLQLETESGRVQVLNDDLSSIKPVAEWVSTNGVSVADPMSLLEQGTFDWTELDEAKFMELAEGTEYTTPYQLGGSGPRN